MTPAEGGASASTAKPFRILPKIAPDTEFFWTSGAEGELRLQRCEECHLILHPPSVICPRCLSKKLSPSAMSGRATVLTYTVNHQQWIPGFDPPYVFAIVEIVEQQGVRLFTNVVDCAIEDVHIGMPVQVRFEHHDDVWLPVFAPVSR